MPDQLATPNPDRDPSVTDDKDLLEPSEIVRILDTYRTEAEDARKGGPSTRDDVWQSNIDLYWGRFDFSQKAAWQSRQVMPEAAQFVDRWAAAIKAALTRNPDWFDVDVPGDTEKDIAQAIIKTMKVWLRRCGRTPDGHAIGFPAIFEDVCKLGAMMMMGTAVTWKTRDGHSYVAVEPLDPQTCWLDATGRGLYRRRKLEMDKHELLDLVKKKDSKGNTLYNVEEVEVLSAEFDELDKVERERLAGHGTNVTSTRKPIIIDEWLATIVNEQGDVIAENALCIVANDKFLIRGPEPNPFWHKRDWLVLTPMVSVPLSVYGKSYMENWAPVARAFVEMTNLIMDGAFMAAMKAFAAIPEMLEDPSELDEGIHANKLFLLEEGADVNNFIKEIELGSVDAGAITVWQALKAEMRDGGMFSEISLGQIPPKGDITATEINQSSQSSSSIIRSIAEVIEERHLEPILHLVWTTGLQHMSENDPELKQELGEEAFQMIFGMRKELAEKHMTFVVRGISKVIEQAQQLQSLMAVLQIVSANELLLREFLAKYSIGRVLQSMLRLMHIDTKSLEPTERDKLLEGIAQPVGADVPAAPGGSPPATPGPAQGAA